MCFLPLGRMQGLFYKPVISLMHLMNLQVCRNSQAKQSLAVSNLGPAADAEQVPKDPVVAAEPRPPAVEIRPLATASAAASPCPCRSTLHIVAA